MSSTEPIDKTTLEVIVDGVATAQDETPKSSEDVKTKEKSPPFSNYWRILSFGTRVEHALITVAIVCAVASGVALPLMNIVFGHLVGDFGGYFIPGSGVTEERFKASVAKNALYIVYLFIGKFVLTYIALFCFRTTGLRISAALRLAYMRSLFAQPIRKLDEVSTGTVANTITTAANTVQLSITDRLSALFQGLALIITAFAIAFRWSWQLTLVTSSGIVFVVVVYGILTPFILKAQQAVDKADEKHATVASEAISSIRTVLSLGAESKLIRKHLGFVMESHKYSLKMAPQIGVQFGPIYFAIYSCYSLAFWYGLKLYREGHIANVGTVIIVFFSVLIVTSILGNVVQPLMYITKAVSASVSFFSMIDSQGVRATGLSAPEVSAQGDIELKDVCFSYPTRPGVQVLKNFSATIRAGKTTALVGPSGSGKSTIVALLERWYELDRQDSNRNSSDMVDDSTTLKEEVERHNQNIAAGTISTSGYSITEFAPKWWRSQIGLVQQEPFLFNDTIERNVAYGLIGTQWEHESDARKSELVREACQEAFADEFIEKLPEKYNSAVGEGGIKLSGGQRQRIAIARSIIRKPAILILDEATSSIDVQGEKIVQAALDRASQNRTTIMIAHRLSTIRKADHIIVLRNGTKIEEGTHNDLLSTPDGLYYALVQAQQIEEDRNPASELDIVLTRSRSKASAHTSDNPLIRLDSVPQAHTDDPELAILEDAAYVKKGFFQSVGILLWEQRVRWPVFGLVLLSSMGCGAAFALQSWLFAQLIQTFQFTGQKLIDAGNHWALMFFILALAVSACYFTLGTSSVTVSTYVAMICRTDYFKSIMKMPISYFDLKENASGSLMSRLSGDPKQLQELLGINSAFPLISVFNIVGCVIISFYFGWKLTLVTFFAALPVIIVASFIRVKHEVQFEKMNSEVFGTSSQFATEAIGAFRTVCSLTMEDAVLAKYDKLLKDQIRASTRRASYAILIYAFSDSVELLGMALTFWYGGQLLASREYQPLQFYVIFAAIIQGAQAAGMYLSITPSVAQSTAAANRIMELRSKVARNESKTKPAMPVPGAQGAKVEFRNVQFTYPSNTTPLFSNLNISIPAGQYVAFVGPSGCGKTSTVSLIERFYNPIGGRILVDDEDISQLDVKSYRQNLSLVAQEPRLFSGTVRQNLLMGVEEAEVEDGDIENACRDAEIHDFIISLPDGYDTELGQHTQTNLSGGQKQRLCLARALLRKPKLLLLDEATSSLDSQSEKLVQGAIERLAGQRSITVVAVAHRLATIQKADIIFVFGEREADKSKGSRIVERGTHRELLSRKGVYWSMCQAQALDR